MPTAIAGVTGRHVRSESVSRVGFGVGNGSCTLWCGSTRGSEARDTHRGVFVHLHDPRWHGAYFLLPRCARRSRKSPGRHPSRRTRFRSSRPHDTPILCHRPAVHRGCYHAAPHALFYRAARRLDHAGEGSTASPSEATPSRQLRDTTENKDNVNFLVCAAGGPAWAEP
jgi:hypothetical protein